MRKLFETAVILLGTIGWWGFVYPELCLTEDVYEQAYEDDETEANIENKALESENGVSGKSESRIPEGGGEEAYPSGVREYAWTDVYQSGWQVGKIRIKSRLAEYVYQVKEK
ncbi:MAG: hypothetical protein K2O16_20295 [Lachnospiraceae bacterium]|nr:hypothetical protein [Lachnospiraceae bacterium]